MKKSEIRAMLLTDSRNLRVRITRKGEIHICTDRKRGDGGKTPWWMFAGYVGDSQFRN